MDDHFEENVDEIQYRFELMNASSECVNELQAELDQQLMIHKSFVINFAENLTLAKKNLNDKAIKNAEQFYLIMHRGKPKTGSGHLSNIINHSAPEN